MGLLVAGMAVCYGVAVVLDRMRHPYFADAAILAGAALFGAAIVLVAQSYHISGDYPDALLTWAGGALLAAVLGPSRGALALAMVVAAIWSWYEIEDFGWTVHWPYLAFWALTAAVAGAWGWSAGRTLALLGLLGWIAVTVVATAEHLDWAGATAMALLAATAFLLFATGRLLSLWQARPLVAEFGPTLSTLAVAAVLLSLFLLQLAFDIRPGELEGDGPVLAVAAAMVLVGMGLILPTRARWTEAGWDVAGLGLPVLAAIGLVFAASHAPDEADAIGFAVALGVIVLAVAAWAAAYGQEIGRRNIARLGIIAFAGEVLYLYLTTFGTLLDTATFFLIGGVLMILLATAVMRIQKRIARPEDAS